MMKVGEVRIADDRDFTHFRDLCDNHSGWSSVYNKRNVQVWTKSTSETSFKMVKIRTDFKDVSAELLYDVIHDPEYRKTWDHNMMEGQEICMLNPNNDIGYYSIRAPAPVKNRDFVTQRSWLDTPQEKIIFNHSVFHAKKPVRKSCVRGVSYLTGYLIRPLGATSSQITYVAHSDPRGSLPAWAINKLTTFVAPKVVSRIHKACAKYDQWKQQHAPSVKPWLNAEQMFESCPRIDWADVREAGLANGQAEVNGAAAEVEEAALAEEQVDESAIQETDLEQDEFPDDGTDD